MGGFLGELPIILIPFRPNFPDLGEAAEDHDELSVVRTVTSMEDAEVTMVFEKLNHSEAKTKPGNVKTNHGPGTPRVLIFLPGN